MSQMKAFPNPTLADTQNNSSERLNDPSEYGMDLRDWFAGLAMQSLLANVCDPIFAESLKRAMDKTGYTSNEDAISLMAYDMATAMMEARCTQN